MDPGRLAGILIVTGAAVGLLSTTVTLWTVFSVMGWLAFALVLVFGVYVSGSARRPASSPSRRSGSRPSKRCRVR